VECKIVLAWKMPFSLDINTIQVYLMPNHLIKRSTLLSQAGILYTGNIGHHAEL
jgi:hypothetical protein